MTFSLTEIGVFAKSIVGPSSSIIVIVCLYVTSELKFAPLRFDMVRVNVSFPSYSVSLMIGIDMVPVVAPVAISKVVPLALVIPVKSVPENCGTHLQFHKQ